MIAELKYMSWSVKILRKIKKCKRILVLFLFFFCGKKRVLKH